LATWIKENGKIPRTREMALKNGLPSANTIKRHFSSVAEALEKTLKHINRSDLKKLNKFEKNWTRKKIIDRLVTWVKDYGRLPKTREMTFKNGLPSADTIKRHFGALDEAYIEAKKRANRTDIQIFYWRNYTREEIIKMFQKWVEKNGRFPKLDEYRHQYNLVSPGAVYNLFGTVHNLKVAMGFDPCKDKVKRILRDDSLLSKYSKEIENMSDETYRNYMRTLTDLRAFLKAKNKKWDDLDDEIIIAYLKRLQDNGAFDSRTGYGKKNSPLSLRTKWRQISAFLTWIIDIAEEKDETPIIKRSMIKRIKRRIRRNKNTLIGDIQPTSRRALTEKEVAQIRTKLHTPYLKNLFDIGLNLGTRLHEYLKMKFSTCECSGECRCIKGIHLDEEGYPPHVHIKGKFGKIRLIVLTKGMVALIKRHLVLREMDGVTHDSLFYGIVTRKEISKKMLGDYFIMMSEETGIKFTSHQLRYTMVTYMLKKGVPKYIIQQRLGHAGDVTDLYSRDKMIERARIIEEKVGVL